jgi:hypothetical protein
MAFSERLAYVVSLDPSNAVAGFGKIGTAAKKSVAEVDAEVKRLEKDIDALNRKQISAGKKGDSLGADIAGIQKSKAVEELNSLKAPASGASGVLSKLGLSSGEAGGGLSSMASSAALAGVALAAVTAGVAAAGSFAEKSVDQFKSSTAEVRAFQRQAGTTAEESSKLVFSFRQIGVDSDTAAGGIFKLGKNIETGKAKLSEFGIETAKDAKGNTDLVGTLLNISDAYRATDDPAQRAAIAFAAFGKQGQALTPILAKGREGIAALNAEAGRTGQVFHAEDLESGRQLAQSTKEASEAFKGLELQAGKALAPAATALAQAAAAGLELGGALKVVGFAAEQAAGPLILLGKLTEHLPGQHKAAKQSADDLAQSQADLADATAQAAAETANETAVQKQNADAAKAQKAAIDDLLAGKGARSFIARESNDAADGIARMSGATDLAAGAAKRLADAQKTQQAATDDLDDAVRKLHDDEREAPRDKQRAEIAAREADRRLAAATKEANRLHLRRPGSSFDQEAQDKLANARIDDLDAHDKVAGFDATTARGLRKDQAAVDTATKAQRTAAGDVKAQTVIQSQFTGPITVLAQDPNDFLKKLDAKYRLQRIGGPS